MKLRLFATSALLAALTGLLLPLASGNAQDSATLALQYLARYQRGDGSIDGAPGETEDFIFGATAAGYDPRTLRPSGGKSVFDFLAGAVSDGSATTSGNPPTTSPAKTAKTILAVLDGKMNPRSFGSPNSQNLISTLCSTYSSSTGSFGSAAPAFDQSLAIDALVLANDASCPLPAQAKSYLETLQDADGGWGFGGASDTNSTAMALMALAAAGDSNGRAKALTYLHGEQQKINDGGFAFSSTTPGTTDSDPDSDALVIQALAGAGQDPGSSTWTVNGKTPLSDIATFQDLNSSDAGYGGFFFARGSAPDSFTTTQVPAGLRKAPFPISPNYTDGTALPGSVVAVTASPSPSAAPSPTPTATAAAAAAPALPKSGAGPAASGRDWQFLAVGIAGLWTALAFALGWVNRRPRMR